MESQENQRVVANTLNDFLIRKIETYFDLNKNRSAQTVLETETGLDSCREEALQWFVSFLLTQSK
jgi:hypothetical protein